MTARPVSPGARAPHASWASEQAPPSGTSQAVERARAVAIPTRSPVYEPGPTPTVTAAISGLATPASASSASSSGTTRAAWSRSTRGARRASSPDRGLHSASARYGPAVSRPKRASMPAMLPPGCPELGAAPVGIAGGAVEPQAPGLGIGVGERSAPFDHHQSGAIQVVLEPESPELARIAQPVRVD